VSRGTAYVHNKVVTAEGISFMVYTQAANDSWFFGWHSGAITVTTSCQWYYITDSAVEGGDGFFTNEGPAVATRSRSTCGADRTHLPSSPTVVLTGRALPDAATTSGHAV
jgi:hypothetical protein